MYKRFFFVLCTVFFLGSSKMDCIAANSVQENAEGDKQEEYLESQMDVFNFKDINNAINDMFPSSNISFDDMLWNTIKGEGKLNLSIILNVIKSEVSSEIGNGKNIFISIFLIGVLSAVFVNFANMFENRQISDISYYLLYLYLVTILLKSFELSFHIAQSCLENIVVFVKILIPTFAMAIGISGAGLSAAGFYQIIIFVIFGIETFLLSFLMPLVYSYVLLVVINGVNEDDKLDSFINMLKKGIKVLLQISIGLVSGISVLQSMVTPVIDNLKVGAFQRVASAIPGIGNITDAVAQMAFGSAILIKNSIGIVFSLVLIIICLVPVFKLLLMTLVVRFSAAVVGLICDKRMSKCTEQVAQGHGMLLRTVITSLFLLLITVAIISISTSRGFGG